MAQSFTIRTLDENDSGDRLNLRKLLWDEPSEEEHVVEMLDIYKHPDTQPILVAEGSDSELIGFLEASIRGFVEDCKTDQVGYLESWFVSAEHRKQGIGRTLVEGAERWAVENGCTEMASDSEVDNEVSLLAHVSLGYGETSRLIHLRKDLAAD